MADTLAQCRPTLTATTADDCVDTGYDVIDHVTGSNGDLHGGQGSPVMTHVREESSESASLSSASSHETVVSVGAARQQPETRDQPEPEIPGGPENCTVLVLQ